MKTFIAQRIAHVMGLIPTGVTASAPGLTAQMWLSADDERGGEPGGAGGPGQDQDGSGQRPAGGVHAVRGAVDVRERGAAAGAEQGAGAGAGRGGQGDRARSWTCGGTWRRRR